MNKILLRGGTVLLVLILLLTACVSSGAGKGSADDAAVSRGSESWNRKGPASARHFWNGIGEAGLRARYIAYVDAHEGALKWLGDAEAKLGQEAAMSASYEKARTALSSIPKDLRLPEETKRRALALAETRVRGLMSAAKLSAALEAANAAEKTFGSSPALASMKSELELVVASKTQETSADALLEKARTSDDFDEKITRFESAASSYQKAETSLGDEASRAKLSTAPAVIAQAARLKKKRQEAVIEKERLLRERAYSFKDRIGEEFARQPEGNSGSMSLEQLLAHQESVKAGVEEAYSQMTSFAARYPRVIDADLILEVEDQKRELDSKIAIVQEEIRTAKDIASRGKTAMPLMIGLFNPQPGSSDEAKKSRPALIRSNSVKGSEYWWGMVSIPKGSMNDLVISLKDNRVVRVYGENTKSGSLIEKNKLKDLVNRGYKVGNSWPVLNAGSQLPTDKYFFEVQEGKTPGYEGEVVVYSSFIMRMR